jgi:hypothetical protein
LGILVAWRPSVAVNKESDVEASLAGTQTDSAYSETDSAEWTGDGLDSLQIVFVAIISVALTIFSIALSYLIYRQFAVSEFERKVLNVPYKAADETLEAQARRLTEFGYNAETKTAMIPIEQAMETVAKGMAQAETGGK